MDLFGHLLLAVLMQVLVVRLCRNWVAGAAVATAWALSREITQAEYRWIERFGDGLRANMPWWGGVDIRVWQTPDPWLDWLLPTLLAGTIAFVASRRRRLSSVAEEGR
ncbi:hypothetical protein [Sphingomonas glaciei]|uniref:Uncharacterized protein n=1 Tax=Sphingomonas glaciei TaxID=2938948 RepID=A0ABY5MVN2_9SPHN|nr:hypothetical protein [Sphingomonas glaciei]UUR08046.1 hypothetical protein M1K48_14160 [Sphingomonas glaciei]